MKHPALDLSGLSARNRRILALGVHGGDGDDALDLDTLLARADGLDDLTDDDLTALSGDLRAAAELTLEERSQEALDRFDRVETAMTAVATAQTTRAEEAARLDAELTARQERLAAIDAGPEDEENDDDSGDDSGDSEGDGQGTETETTTTTETVTTEATGPAEVIVEIETPDAEVVPIAASARTPVASRVAARRPSATRPRVTEPEVHPATILRASANMPNVSAGSAITNGGQLRTAFESVLRASAGYRGARMQIPVASLGASDPEEIYGRERTLGRDARVNEERIEAVTSGPALRASGGICAPAPIDYTLPVTGSDARPVRDALARFGADRGGIRLLPAVTLADVDGAVDIWTHANDITPSDPATKPCAVLDCPDDVETLVDAITRCLTVGNFRARFFGEQPIAWMEKIGQLYARVAENNLLAKIAAGSTAVSAGGEVLGTTREVLRSIGLLAAGMRSRRRLDQNFPLRLIGPMWLLNNMIEDLAAEMPGATDERLAMSEGQVERFFASRHINVTWSLDGEAGQIFGAQGVGNMVAWPNEVILYLFVEGTWLFLDGGTLDLGLVRDSTLNSTNDAQFFSEGFENAAFHGEESFKVTMPICASGATAAGVDTAALCVANS